MVRWFSVTVENIGSVKTVTAPPPSITTVCPLPSILMARLSVSVPFVSVICVPAPLGQSTPKMITSNTVPFAVAIASRSEPVPLSWQLLTVSVVAAPACTGGRTMRQAKRKTPASTRAYCGSIAPVLPVIATLPSRMVHRVCVSYLSQRTRGGKRYEATSPPPLSLFVAMHYP